MMYPVETACLSVEKCMTICTLQISVVGLHLSSASNVKQKDVVSSDVFS